MNEEERWIEEAKHASASAFVGLVRLHQGRVRAYLLRYIRSQEVADDLAQETFLAAFRDIGSYQAKSPFGIWLLGIARHRALDYLREEQVRRANQGRLFESALARWRAQEAAGDEANLGERALELSALRECIAALPPASGDLIAQHYFGGTSLADVARRLGRTEGAVKMLFFRIRESLRECVHRRVSPARSST